EIHFSFVPAIVFAVVATAVLALLLELVLWRPMRRRGAGVLQLLLLALGLAFVIRNTIQLVAGTAVRTLGANVTAAVTFGGGLHIGRTELWIVAAALVVLASLALLLRRSRLGRDIRALSDSAELAETSRID